MDADNESATIDISDEGGRIDAFLSVHLGISRSKVQGMLADGLVLVNGFSVKKNRVLNQGDIVTWTMPEPGEINVLPEPIPVDIVYEDEHIVVINKRAGLVMYPGPGHIRGTLLNALLERYPEMRNIGGKGRSGIFHRLDKDTSGLVAVARTQESYLEMVRKIKAREVERGYIALVTGNIPADNGTIDAPMGRSRTDRKKMSVKYGSGKRAVSRFTVMERFPQGYTMVAVTLETGRTHQIRVHFSHIGYPVVGDKSYSRGKSAGRLGLDRQFLHAARLKFDHPVYKQVIELNSSLPQDLSLIIEELRLEMSMPE